MQKWSWRSFGRIQAASATCWCVCALVAVTTACGGDGVDPQQTPQENEDAGPGKPVDNEDAGDRPANDAAMSSPPQCDSDEVSPCADENGDIGADYVTCGTKACVDGQWDRSACGRTEGRTSFYEDKDGDGFGDRFLAEGSIRLGTVPCAQIVVTQGDCNDNDANEHPGAAEVCDNSDDDCDRELDEGTSVCGFSCSDDKASCDDAVQLSVGNLHTCARRASGTVACWGSNATGQSAAELDANTVAFPSIVPEISGAIWIAGYLARTCVLEKTGIVCWGGDARTPELHPFAPPSNTVEIALADKELCTRSASGAVSCWYEGQARQVIATGAQQLSMGPTRSCAVGSSGRVDCWTPGKNPTELVASGVLEVRVSLDGVCVRDATGVRCTGVTSVLSPVDGMNGALGLAISPSGGLRCAYTADRIGCWSGEPPTNTWAQAIQQVAVSGDRSCILDGAGLVRCYQADAKDSRDLRAKQSAAISGDLRPVRGILGSSEVGPCSPADVVILKSRTWSLTSDLQECTETCKTALDPVTCHETCAADVKTDLGAACFACLTSYERCDGADCYTKRTQCLGFNPDFHNAEGGHCKSSACDALKEVGTACAADSECYSYNCSIPYYLREHEGQRVCVWKSGGCQRLACESCGEQTTDVCTSNCTLGGCPSTLVCRTDYEGDYWCDQRTPLDF